jgi:hypothetical protein
VNSEDSNGLAVAGAVPDAGSIKTSSGPLSAPSHDKEMAGRFLAGLDPNATRFTFQLFSDCGTGPAQIFHGTLDEVWPKVLALNTPQHGFGVFVTINETDFGGRSAKNIVRGRALFADADGKEQVARCTTMLKRNGVYPSMVVNSGRGAHVYFCTDVPLDQFSALQELLSAKLGTDGAVKDRPRVMRLPGTWHLKDPANPRLVKLVDPGDDPVQRWHLPDLVSKLGLLPSPEAPENNVVPFKAREEWPIEGQPAAVFAQLRSPIESLTEGLDANVDEIRSAVTAIPPSIIADEGNWMRLARGLAHEARVFKKEQEMWEILDAASRRADNYDEQDNRRRFDRYMDEALNREDPITIGTVFHMAAEHGWRGWSPQLAPAVPEPIWSTEELKVSFANIPHRRWLYGTYLIRGEITVLAAPGGAGKTALATGIAVEIAAGNSKLGETLWRSYDQKVLYINGEDSRTEIARRLWAFCLEHKISEQDIARLSIAAADDPRVQSMSFLRVSERATVLNEDGFNCLRAALETLRPDLVVLDPLVVFCGGGNMNDNAVMSLVMRRLKALAVMFDCAMLVVHHTRKGRSTGDDPAEEAERIGGAAAIVNLARRAIMPVTMTNAETKAYPSVLPSERFKYFKLADVKSNLAPLSAEAPWYELATVDLPNAEPPTYPHGDRVQAVKRARLTRQKAGSPLGSEQLAIRFELMKLVDRGVTIDGETVPYSPNSTGKNNQRAILDTAMAAVERATPDREWLSRDLRASIERELEALKQEGCVVVEEIKTGRFRRGHGLQPVWERTPWAKERENLQQHGGPTVRTEQENEQLEENERRDCLEKAERSMGQ